MCIALQDANLGVSLTHSVWSLRTSLARAPYCSFRFCKFDACFVIYVILVRLVRKSSYFAFYFKLYGMVQWKKRYAWLKLNALLNESTTSLDTANLKKRRTWPTTRAISCLYTVWKNGIEFVHSSKLWSVNWLATLYSFTVRHIFQLLLLHLCMGLHLPMRFGSRGPSEFSKSSHSSRIRHQNALTEKAWEDTVQD